MLVGLVLPYFQHKCGTLGLRESVDMDFKTLLDTLARSSAEAVSTLSKSSDEVEELRSYLYVETEIEHRFVEALKTTNFEQSLILLLNTLDSGEFGHPGSHYRGMKIDVRIFLISLLAFAKMRGAFKVPLRTRYDWKV